MAEPLEVFPLPLGPLQANCFVVVQGQTGLVIDPGDEAGVIISAFTELGFAPAAVDDAEWESILLDIADIGLDNEAAEEHNTETPAP